MSELATEIPLHPLRRVEILRSFSPIVPGSEIYLSDISRWIPICLRRYPITKTEMTEEGLLRPIETNPFYATLVLIHSFSSYYGFSGDAAFPSIVASQWFEDPNLRINHLRLNLSAHRSLMEHIEKMSVLKEMKMLINDSETIEWIVMK